MKQAVRKIHFKICYRDNMTDHHSKILLNKRVALVEGINLVSLWDHLLQERVVTAAEKQQIICNVSSLVKQ